MKTKSVASYILRTGTALDGRDGPTPNPPKDSSPLLHLLRRLLLPSAFANGTLSLPLYLLQLQIEPLKCVASTPDISLILDDSSAPADPATRDSSQTHAGRETHPPECRALRTELHRQELCGSYRIPIQDSSSIRRGQATRLGPQVSALADQAAGKDHRKAIHCGTASFDQQHRE